MSLLGHESSFFGHFSHNTIIVAPSFGFLKVLKLCYLVLFSWRKMQKKKTKKGSGNRIETDSGSYSAGLPISFFDHFRQQVMWLPILVTHWWTLKERENEVTAIKKWKERKGEWSNCHKEMKIWLTYMPGGMKYCMKQPPGRNETKSKGEWSSYPEEMKIQLKQLPGGMKYCIKQLSDRNETKYKREWSSCHEEMKI